MTPVVPIVAATLLLAALAGCAPAPAAAPALDAVLAERRAAVDEAEADRLAAFVAESGGRLTELGLPLPSYRGLVDIAEWDAVVTACIEGFDPGVQIARLEGGFQVLDPNSATESIDRIRWTIESCSAQYGRVDLRGFEGEPGPVERAWRYRDAVDRVLPCLRASGFPVPDPPRAEALVGWNPYARIALEASELERARALCPPSSAVLDDDVSGDDDNGGAVP